MRHLLELARLAGIQTSYEDMDGATVKATPAGIAGILEAMGHSVGSSKDASDLLEREKQVRARRLLEPVHVSWDGKPTVVSMNVPVDVRSIRVIIAQEDGTELVRDVKTAGRRGTAPVRFMCPALPLGYHQLTVHADQHWARSLLISAPRIAYSPPKIKRRWGIFAPAYGLQSERSWGIGSFTDLERLGRWAAELEGGVVATLPLTAAFLGKPVCEPSPYSPASRLFWNEVFLDIEALPEFERCAEARKLANSSAFRAELAQLRAAPTVDYLSLMRVKREVLALLSDDFFSGSTCRRTDFDAYLLSNARLNDYASFRAVCESAGSSWHTWEPRLKRGRIEANDFQLKDWQCHAYAQWNAELQMSDVSRGCRREGAALYLDLPLGAHPDSYDLWAERGNFALSASVGAPPDAFFSKGQDWGFSPLHPQAMRDLGYSYIREFLQFQMRHASVLRIDHVMGLHRLYWIPHGLSGKDGAYVTYPHEELYAILCLESLRHKATLVGENLGTVPPQVNESLARHGIRTMYVLPFEQKSGTPQVLAKPASTTVASINTHDMPTFSAHAKGGDIEDRLDLGLIRPRDVSRLHKERKRALRELADFLRREGSLENEHGDVAPVELWKACARWLAAGPAETVLLNLEDFWGELQPQNVPGTSTERPNWKRKLRHSIEEIERMEDLREFLLSLNQLRKRSPKPASPRSSRSGARS